MSDDSLDYLLPGFDPATLTIPRLRSILITYDIPYPGSAKKPQLIQIFKENVLPQARKILATRARAKRTSEGIIDADSQDSTTTSSQADEELEDSPPPPPRRATRSTSPRKTMPKEVYHEEPLGRTPRRIPSRSAAKHTIASDTDDAEEQIQRSMRRAIAAPRRAASPRKFVPAEPAVKHEESDEGSRTTDKKNPFSHDNPFQSGSSPPSGRRSTSDSRRKTVGMSDVRDSIRKKASDPGRRRTDGIPQSAADRGIHPPSAATFKIPASRMDRLTDVDDNGVEASEEFTPEAQEELFEERAQKGSKALGPLRPKKKSSGFSLVGPIWVILLTILAGYAAWYRKEKIAVGYCGVGRPATPIISSKFSSPEWLTILAEPKCEPCPQHAYCYSDLETKCDPDFVLTMHPLSLGGLIPLPPTCEPDSEKVKKVQAVANRAIEELRDRRAKFECGELRGEDDAPEATAEVEIERLKQEVSKKRRKAMSDEEFEELWNGAIGEIKARDEVESKVDSTTDRETLSSNSLALVSFSCSLRRSFRITLAKYYGHIGFVMLCLLGVSVLYRKIIANRTAEARIPELVALTLDRLHTQASLNAQDDVTFPEGWISIGQLRDDVLRDEHNFKKRENLWKKVKAVVEMNANVRAGQRESRNGDISRVWEWIGNVVPVNLPEGSSKKKAGRVSFGTYGEAATPVSGNDGGPRWPESGPIY